MGPPIFIGGKLTASVEVDQGTHTASMGPPIFIGGKDPREGGHREGGEGFNGAADFYRRKAAPYRTEEFRIARLQWGRRFLSAERKI